MQDEPANWMKHKGINCYDKISSRLIPIRDLCIPKAQNIRIVFSLKDHCAGFPSFPPTTGREIVVGHSYDTDRMHTMDKFLDEGNSMLMGVLIGAGGAQVSRPSSPRRLSIWDSGKRLLYIRL